MESPEGTLCDVCIAALSGKAKITESNWHRKERDVFSIKHHTTYKDFKKSKESGCLVCSWLWLKHLPPPSSNIEQDASTIIQDGVSVLIEQFRIFCRLYSGPKGSIYVNLYVICPWDKDFELKCKYQSQRPRFYWQHLNLLI